MSSSSECVLINGVQSSAKKLHFGVPQGCCLGPVMLTQYANTPFDVIENHLDSGHGYANDHQLYLAFFLTTLSSEEQAISKMEKCLTDVKL